jgi:Zn finger protein HypA/HybF involved in hydrogenase expression
MVDAESTCQHCKKRIKGNAKLVGMTIVCPYCGKPSENIRLGETETGTEAVSRKNIGGGNGRDWH